MTFDDADFAERVRAIAKQLDDLDAAPRFDPDKVLNIAVTFEKEGGVGIAHFTLALKLSDPPAED